MSLDRFEVVCPQCGAELMLDDPALIGKEVSCPECGFIFVAGQADDSERSEKDVPSEARPETKETFPQNDQLDKEENADDEEILPVYKTLFFRISLVVIFVLAAAIAAVLSFPPSKKSSSGAKPVSSVEIETPSSSEDSADSIPDEEIAHTPSEEEEVPLEGESILSQDEYIEEKESFDSEAVLENESKENNEEPDSLAETADLLPGAEDEASSGPEALEESPADETKEKSSEEVSASEEEGRAEEEFDVETNSDDTAVPVLPVLSRVLEPVDISKRLTIAIERIKLVQATLPDMIRIVSELSGIPIELDWNSFPYTVSRLEERRSLDAENLTVNSLLKEITLLFGLTSVAADDRIKVFDPLVQKTETETLSDDLSDLVAENGEVVLSEGENDSPVPCFPDHLTASVIESAVKDLVFPASGTVEASAAGDDEPSKNPEIHFEGNTLAVTADVYTVARTNLFLDKLRSLRNSQKDLKTSAEEQIPQTLCWENHLSQTQSFNLLRPVSLREALLVLGKANGISFFYDLPELRLQGVDPDIPVKVMVPDQPFDLILREILSPNNLDYIVLTENLVVVTSKEKASKEMSCEVHFYAEEGSEISSEKSLELAQRIKAEIVPESWTEESENPGKIWIDPVSSAFLVYQSQPIQRKIERWLLDRGEENETEPK